MAIIQFSSQLDFGNTRPEKNVAYVWMTGLWEYQTRKKCCLRVDGFGVKYFSKDDANHFLNPLKITMHFQRIERDAINSN